jgi:hypothetical protein
MCQRGVDWYKWDRLEAKERQEWGRECGQSGCYTKGMMIGRTNSGRYLCLDAALDVKMANHAEKIVSSLERSDVPRFRNNFVPQGTQVVLQARKRISDVKTVK